MIVGGCDVGSATGKAVVMQDGKIVSHVIIPSTTKPEVTARTAMDEAVSKAGLSSIEDLGFIVGTGYGRLKVPFANENVSEITCHARGANWMSPSFDTRIQHIIWVVSSSPLRVNMTSSSSTVRPLSVY